jgi:hypothetical protein
MGFEQFTTFVKNNPLLAIGLAMIVGEMVDPAKRVRGALEELI